MRTVSPPRLRILGQFALLLLGACSDPSPATPSGSGSGVGGAGSPSVSGGTGGSTVASGGTTLATGGTVPSTGGVTNTGGVVTTGGVVSTGGTSGGAAGSGGKNPGGAGGSAGAAGNGGATAGGGGKNGGGSGGGSGGAGGTPNGGSAGKGGSAGSGGAADSPAAAIDKFRFECPCKAGAPVSDGNCDVTPETDRQTIVKTMGGDATKVYNVTLRVRGLTEPNTYRNGMLQGERSYIGGTTNSPGYTSYMMTVADPAQHYFFNYSATTGHTHFKLDYQVTVKIRGGSRVTFDVDGDGSVPDGHQVANFDQMVVPDVPPAPEWYNGQFVQLDVVSVEVAP